MNEDAIKIGDTKTARIARARLALSMLEGGWIEEAEEAARDHARSLQSTISQTTDQPTSSPKPMKVQIRRSCG